MTPRQRRAELPIRVVTADHDLSPAEAREITRRIRNGVADLELLLTRAYLGRAWLALKYETWDDYVAGEFRTAPLALPREARRASSQSLNAWGLSARAIASVTGVSRKTAQRDLLRHSDAIESEHQPPPETPRPIVAVNGKPYPRARIAAVPTTRPRAVVVCPTCHGTGEVAQ